MGDPGDTMLLDYFNRVQVNSLLSGSIHFKTATPLSGKIKWLQRGAYVSQVIFLDNGVGGHIDVKVEPAAVRCLELPDISAV